MPKLSSSALLLAAAGGLSLAATASADTMYAASAGYGLNVNLDATLVEVQVGPLPGGVMGSGSTPYSLSGSVVDLDVDSGNALATGTVTADLVTGSASSNVDGLPGPRTASASGGVVGANIDLTTLPLLGSGIPIFAFDGTLSSEASVSGDSGSFIATGSSTFESLALTVNNVVIDLSAYVGVEVAPNTVIDLDALGLANVTLTLNQQLVAFDQSSIEVNALHLDLGVIGVLEGDVTLGHSSASLAAVPEPATLLATPCLAALTLTRRRRR